MIIEIDTNERAEHDASKEIEDANRKARRMTRRANLAMKSDTDLEQIVVRLNERAIGD